MENVKTVIMRRDGLTEEEADELIRDAKEDLNIRLMSNLSIDSFMAYWFGLEDDYLFELLGI